MTEEQINTFLSILRRGSFSGAAQELYMSQPAVTHRIKTLEEELGLALFIRDSSRAVLTPAGQIFAREAQNLHNAFVRAHDSLLPFLQNNTLRIGFPSVMVIGECRAFFAVMNLSGHDEHLQLHSVLLSDATQNAHRLMKGDIDLVFSDIDPSVYTSSQFGKKIIFRCTAYACVHRDHRWAQLKALPQEELKNELVYRYRDSTHFSTQFSQLMHDLPLPRVTEEFDTITQALAQLTPQQGVVITNGKWMDSPTYTYLPLDPGVSMRIGVIWMKNRMNPALRMLVDRIAALPQSIWRI